ncbi:MAG: UTP--glucose-1-phosphate uridylyltransferase GalU [Euryarchaeota archaeon]|nr:UTP--glucose-1-phosphate uridylyltransferase GalU [Euryarchaeota archaeon]
MKAVIPAAGHGTRFLPATKNSPKEMLPLLDKPAIQYVVEEAVQSGIDDILIITGRGKRAIEDHFDRALELELLLKEKGDHANLKMVQDIADMAQIHYIRQKEQKGLGHAILQAKKHIGNEPFAVLLGDDIVFSKKPCTLQLIDQYMAKRSPIIAVERIPRERSVAYGVVKPAKAVSDHLYPIEDLVEKPRPEEAPSDLGILGRYVLTPEIFAAIEETKPGKNGEIQLTDALRLLRAKQPLYAYEFYGKRYDLGNKMDWLKTNVEVALMQDEYREELRRFLGEMVRNEK